MPENSENLTLRDMFRMLLMRWPMLVIAIAVFAIGTLVCAHYLPLEYTGKAIFERRQDIAVDQTSIRGSESFEGRKLTLKYELAGLGATTEAIEQLGLTRGLSRDDDGQLTLAGQKAKRRLVEQIMGKISIRWEVSSAQVDLVSVSFTDSDAWLAEQMPNTLVENYINRVSEDSVENLSTSRSFLENQVKMASNRFSELMKLRIDFEINNAGILPDSPASLHEGVIRLNSDIDSLRLENAIARQQLVQLEGLKPTGVRSSEDPNGAVDNPLEVHYGANPDYVRFKDELQMTKETLVVVLEVKQEKHPDVEMLRQRIARLEMQLEQTEPEAILKTVYGTVRENTELAIQLLARRSEAEMTEKELGRLEKRLESYQNLLSNFGPIRREYLGIIKNLEDKQVELTRWEGKLMGVHMALAAEVAKRRTHLNAVQPALEQFYPSSPSFRKVFLFALFGGMAFGAGLLFLANRLDRSIVTPEQASRSFGFPVFGFIDVIMTPRQLSLRRVKRWIFTPIISLILGVALLLSSGSLHLRLDYPKQYEQWRAEPLKYVSGQIGQFFNSTEQ